MGGVGVDGVAQDHGVSSRKVVTGLDTLRFITALWVAFSHGARFPIDRLIQPETMFDKLLLLLGKTTFNGTAAVAVFFLISGFLIHGGNVGRRTVDIWPFWTRRCVRIGLPLLAVIALARLLGPGYVANLDKILWSVYAEIIYYLLYPLLLPAIYRFGITTTLVVSLLISLVMITFNPHFVYLWSFGHELTWLFCAPLWLMGCYLAEHRQRVSDIARSIPTGVFRLCAIGYCYASTILATHLGEIAIGYTWTIWIFGAFCIFWLASEIDRGFGRRTWVALERFGLAGYSMYLVHKLVITYTEVNLQGFTPVLYWVSVLLGIAAATWAFYRIVEFPSHTLARSLGRIRLQRHKGLTG